MKKRMGSLLLACLMCLCLLPATAQAAEWYQTDVVYEVKPFYIEYLVASAPASEIREMTEVEGTLGYNFKIDACVTDGQV